MKTKILLSSFLFLLFFALIPNLTRAIEYGQMGGRPTYYDPSVPDSQSWFIYNLDPGVSKEDSMTVANLYNDSWVAVIYAADSIKSSSGGFALRQLTEPKDAVGSWVKFYPDPKPEFANKVFEEKKTIDEVCKVSGDDLKNNYELNEEKVNELGEWCKGKELVELEMGAGDRRDLLFVITIPEGADVGEHTGGILIQKKSKDEADQGDGSKVMLTTRVGVRIYETVPGEIVRKLNFSDFQITNNFDEFFLPWDDLKKDKFREYLITSKINNPGNASTDFGEKINIHNVITRKNEVIDNRNFQVLRGDDFTSSLAWKGPRLAYLSFQKEYRYKDSDGNEQIIHSESIKKWFIPWREMVIFVFFALVAGAIYYVWKRYQRKNYGGIGWVDYMIKDGDTIQTLSTKFEVAWKVLVKTNKLKAPYILEAGKIIKVPNLVDGDSEETMLPPSIESREDVISPKEEEMIDLDIESEENLEVKAGAVEKGEEMPEDKKEEGREVSYVVDEDKIESKPEAENKDIINSDLFFGEEEFDAQKPQRIEFEEKTAEIKEDAPAKEDLIKKETKPLLKKEVKSEKAVVEEDTLLREEENSEELFIKGVKEDSKRSINWLVYILLLVIITLLGGIAFLLIQNRSNNKIVVSNELQAVDEKESPIAENQPIEEPKEPQAEEPAEEIDTTKLSIKVFNGSGVAGAAGKVKDFLVSKEYEKVETGNYSSEEVTGSTIYYSQDNLEEEARWLADILKDKDIQAEVKLASTDEEKSAELVIVLGK